MLFKGTGGEPLRAQELWAYKWGNKVGPTEDQKGGLRGHNGAKSRLNGGRMGASGGRGAKGSLGLHKSNKQIYFVIY